MGDGAAKITNHHVYDVSIDVIGQNPSKCFDDDGHLKRTEIKFSQIPDFDQIWWLSIVAAVMSFTYSAIGLAPGIVQVATNNTFKGSFTGISVGIVTETQKIWMSF